MIGVSREATPVQVNRIMCEVYSKEHRWGQLHQNPSFRRTHALNSRRKIVYLTNNNINSTSQDRVIHPTSGGWTDLSTPAFSLAPGDGSVALSACSRNGDCHSVESASRTCSPTQGGLNYPVDLPPTSSQAIGWVLCPELRSTSRWRKPRVTGPVVKYAEIYYEQNRINPFKHRSK